MAPFTRQHEEIILHPLNPAYSSIVIPNAEDEEFMAVAEVVEKDMLQNPLSFYAMRFAR